MTDRAEVAFWVLHPSQRAGLLWGRRRGVERGRCEGERRGEETWGDGSSPRLSPSDCIRFVLPVPATRVHRTADISARTRPASTTLFACPSTLNALPMINPSACRTYAPIVSIVAPLPTNTGVAPADCFTAFNCSRYV